MSCEGVNVASRPKMWKSEDPSGSFGIWLGLPSLGLPGHRYLSSAVTVRNDLNYAKNDVWPPQKTTSPPVNTEYSLEEAGAILLLVIPPEFLLSEDWSLQNSFDWSLHVKRRWALKHGGDIIKGRVLLERAGGGGRGERPQTETNTSVARNGTFPPRWMLGAAALKEAFLWLCPLDGHVSSAG